MTTATETEATPILANRSYERNVLSCSLNNPDMLEMVDLDRAAFESDDMRAIWNLICDLRAAGHDTVNLATLRMFYDSREDFYEVIKTKGGFKFIESVFQRPDFTNFTLHLEELRERFKVRMAKVRAVAALRDIEHGQFKSAAEVFALVDTHLEEPSTAAQREVLRAAITPDWLEEQTRKFLAGEFRQPGIDIINPQLAHAFGGLFYHGGMYVWTGETNVGKSQVVQMLLRLFCIGQGVPTLVIDNEMSVGEFRDRLVASAGNGCTVKELATGKAYDPAHAGYGFVKKAVDQLQDAPYEWRKVLDLNIKRIEPLVRRFLRRYPKEQYPHKILIVDGIKMTSEQDSYFEVGFFAQQLKELTDRLSGEGLVSHVTCQLQRPPRQSAKEKAANPPDHNNIGLSKLIADNATDVIVITKHYDENVGDGGGWAFDRRRMYIPKARNHPTLEDPDYLIMEFDGDRARMNPHHFEGPCAEKLQNPELTLISDNY